MVEKPEARGAPQKTGDPEKQKAQSARFIEAAHDVGFDESGNSFEKALAAMSKAAK